MVCPTCHRDAANLDSGFWERIRTCPACGAFSWRRPPRPPAEHDPLAVWWHEAFSAIGFAIDFHKRWVQRPWLTKPICTCHPQLRC